MLTQNFCAKSLLIALFASFFLSSCTARSANPTVKVSSMFDQSLLSQKQAFVRVEGNKLVDDAGQQVIFKGVSIADPDKLIKENQWSIALFTELKNWGVNIVRLPIHPQAWRERGQQDYLKHIDEAVMWANRLGFYLIIDWHSIGYLPNNVYQDPMYVTDFNETKAFWQTIATRYKGVSTIAVYELFNEPTDLGGKAGTADWSVWKTMNEELIDLIYAHDTQVIPLVAGFNWAYDLRPIKTQAIERQGIAYSSHPYPQKTSMSIISKEQNFALWQRDWGFAAADYPIIVTELGWVQADGYGAHIPVKNDGSYGPQIIEFMAKRDISWVAWVFDPQWSPTMISDWQFTPTEQGRFFKQQMQK